MPFAAAQGAAGGAAAATGLKGLAGRLAPLARRAGLVGIGVSLIAGATAAFGDKSAQASFSGKVGNFLKGAIGMGAKDYTAEAAKIRAAILKGADPGRFSTPRASRPGGTPSGTDREAGFNDQTQKQLARLREIRRDAERLFGKQVVLRVGVKSSDLFLIKQNFEDMRKGGTFSVKELSAAVDTNLALIKRNMDVHSKGGQRAVTENFRAAMSAVTRSLASGRLSTGESMRMIERLMATHSRAGKEATQRNFLAAVRSIKGAMVEGSLAAEKGSKQIQKIMRAYLESFGIKGREAKILVDTYSPTDINRMVSGDTRLPEQRGGGRTRSRGEARGGIHTFGRRGDKGPDTIPALIGGEQVMVGSGEIAAVLNSTQQAGLNSILAPYGGLPGFMRAHNKPHFMASGGIVALGRQLQREGYSVTEHPAFGGVRFQHAPGGYHYTGQAIDVNDDDAPGGEMASLDRLFARLQHLPGIVELLWRVADHFDHLHVAMGDGASVAGLMAAVPKLPRMKVKGKGAVAMMAQASVDIVRKGAQRVLAEKLGSLVGPGAGPASAGVVPGTQPSGSDAALMRRISAKHGWNFADWWEVDRRETGHGTNLFNESSGAALRGQFMPGLTQGQYGPGSAPWLNPTMTQQIWSMAKYILERYGNPTAARVHHDAFNWYGRGGILGAASGLLKRKKKKPRKDVLAGPGLVDPTPFGDATPDDLLAPFIEHFSSKFDVREAIATTLTPLDFTDDLAVYKDAEKTWGTWFNIAMLNSAPEAIIRTAGLLSSARSNIERIEGMKSEPKDNSQLLELLRTQNQRLTRSLAVSEAHFDVFQGMLPLLGGYLHGGRLPATGLYLGHKDEWVVPDPQGPFGSQLSGRVRGGDGPKIEVVVKGGIGPLVNEVEVLVDGKLAKHQQRLEQRSRTFSRAPGHP